MTTELSHEAVAAAGDDPTEESAELDAELGVPVAQDGIRGSGDYDADELARSQDWIDGGAELFEIEDFMFRMLVDDLPESVSTFTPDGRFVWCNRAWLALPGEEWGLTNEDVAGHRLEELLTDPEQQEELRKRREALDSLTPERPVVTQNFSLWGGRVQQILYKAWFMDDTPVFYVAIGRDHTQALRADARLRESMRRLEESNRDLQDFAYVASHDLQEPLRKIIAFTDRFRATVGELDEKPADYLDRVQNASERMQRLIDDLLTFSRVTTRGEAFAPVDLGVVVAGVLDDLEVVIGESGATVTVGALPQLDADATQMRQLFQNLIGNALKFRRPDLAPEVRVHARAVEDHALVDGDPHRDFWELTVSDNGIGFDEKYANKIFTVFQRLHGRGDYEGSGIGLSVVRRIAERHEGQVRAVSAEGAGATFVITVPAHLLADQAERDAVL